MTSSARDRLADLRQRPLPRLHGEGSAPDPRNLRGVLDGAVLSGTLDHPLLRPLRLWRGKVFDPPETATSPVTGRNRLGAGPLEVRRFQFEARPGRSLFDDRDVLLLNHDLDGNPDGVRRFHDELVEIDDGLYLATSYHRPHHRLDGTPHPGLRFLCYFALARPSGSWPHRGP